jgi:hypothetical protein
MNSRRAIDQAVSLRLSNAEARVGSRFVADEVALPAVIPNASTFVHKVPRQLKKTPLEHFFSELPNLYLNRDIKSVSELYGQVFQTLLSTSPGAVDQLVVDARYTKCTSPTPHHETLDQNISTQQFLRALQVSSSRGGTLAPPRGEQRTRREVYFNTPDVSAVVSYVRVSAG